MLLPPLTPPSVTVTPWQLPTQQLANLYERANEDHYALVAGVQSCFLGGASDAMSQSMHGLPVSFAHVAAMAASAMVLSGMLGALWLRSLEEAIPGTSIDKVVAKTGCDYLFCATLSNSAYLACVPILTALFSGASLEAASHAYGWTAADFSSTMRLEALTFAPYNLLQFRLIPPSLRPLSSAALSAGCTIVISGLTLGFHS